MSVATARRLPAEPAPIGKNPIGISRWISRIFRNRFPVFSGFRRAGTEQKSKQANRETNTGFCRKGDDITVKTRGGDLIVNYSDEGITLTGNAELIYEGRVEY